MVAVSSLGLWAATTWSQLPVLDRTRLTMALLAFVLLFLGVVTVALLLGRMVKREVRKPLPPVRDLSDAWAEKPLNAANERSKPPASPTDESSSA